MKYITSALLCAMLTVMSTGVMASTFRCGSQLVSLGDRSFQVLKKCGEPVARETVGYTIGDKNGYTGLTTACTTTYVLKETA